MLEWLLGEGLCPVTFAAWVIAVGVLGAAIGEVDDTEGASWVDYVRVIALFLGFTVVGSALGFLCLLSVVKPPHAVVVIWVAAATASLGPILAALGVFLIQRARRRRSASRTAATGGDEPEGGG